MAIKKFLSTHWEIISVGAFIGVLAPLLQALGNPGNMGICVACFERDIAGAIGIHRASVVQFMRPEIIGFVMSSLAAAYIFKEFRPRSGSAPIVRFVLGLFRCLLQEALGSKKRVLWRPKSTGSPDIMPGLRLRPRW